MTAWIGSLDLSPVLGFVTYLLAQATNGTTGNTPPAGDGTAEQGGGGFVQKIFSGPYSFPMMIAMFIFIFYFLVIRPEKNRQKAREALLGAVKKGDTVITTAGIVAQVHKVEDKEIVLQVDKDSKARVRFLKSAITEVLNPDGSSESK